MERAFRIRLRPANGRWSWAIEQEEENYGWRKVYRPHGFLWPYQGEAKTQDKAIKALRSAWLELRATLAAKEFDRWLGDDLGTTFEVEVGA